MSGASEQANRRASGPVLQSVFLAVLDHSVLEAHFNPREGVNPVSCEELSGVKNTY